MLVPAIVDLFKFKLVGGIIVLTCWSAIDRVNFMKQFSSYGMMVIFTCNTFLLDQENNNRFYGILIVRKLNFILMMFACSQLRPKHFSQWYKWVIVNEIPQFIYNARYDADVVLLRNEKIENITNLNEINTTATVLSQTFYDDVYIHPRDGVATNVWAYWNPTGIQITHGRERILRRLDLKQYPLRIATPLGQYSADWYNGTFKDYLLDVSMPEHDSGVRCAYAASLLLIEALNAKDVLYPTELWSTEIHNSSMLLMLSYGSADLGGGVLRILPNRITRLDYALPIWPFRVGFTYLSERESSSNMFVVPFTAAVWWTCFGFVLLMTLAQRVTAMKPVEKEGAFMAVLATYLQQDASAVPEGASGRWTFVVVSVFSMLIHAYYTSAIVSDLMSTGRSGPDSLRALADSKYAIASEDYDYMRYLMFDVETNWDELEYLKNKKLTSRFYVDMERGVDLIRRGYTAYHTEYNQLYPHLKTFTDDQLCKLQYVDTIPESVTWVTTTKRGQWLEYLRSKGGWVTEVGLAKRLVSNLRLQPPPCRTALLAERVKFGDIAPLLALSVLGTALSLFILGIEIIFAKLKDV
ncbi:uncharacterized protein LOC106718577 [Papilio machaon]|uniref:uncharacterized protein LOC106718577 n=1 Tax=Papilio machaon TaxID=76193 RepID=UPI001E6656CF|nr:uncharacterized protein LOC106718577 [Papilio machaon]